MADRPDPSGERHGINAGPILAGIVVYNPDPVHLVALVETLKAQVACVVLFLNSALPPDLDRRFAAEPNVSTIAATSNLGIGTGLNVLTLEACLRGMTGLVLFDQDSSPPADLVERLRTGWITLMAAGRHPAVVSPTLVATPGASTKAPTYRYRGSSPLEGLREVSFVPTSGSLIAVDVLRRVGLFRADFFIDGIDLEWSFRAASKGLSCWVRTDCPMPHAVGSGVIGLRWTGWRMPRQRPFRMFCVLRNTIYGLRLAHIPLGWKMKQIAYLGVQAIAFALHHRLDPRILRLLALGIVDGMAGRLGVPRGLADARAATFDAL